MEGCGGGRVSGGKSVVAKNGGGNAAMVVGMERSEGVKGPRQPPSIDRQRRGVARVATPPNAKSMVPWEALSSFVPGVTTPCHAVPRGAIAIASPNRERHVVSIALCHATSSPPQRPCQRTRHTVTADSFLMVAKQKHGCACTLTVSSGYEVATPVMPPKVPPMKCIDDT